MAEILLFHHAQGLTRGCVAFAGRLRAAGHAVHTPDLYDGRTFTDLSDGIAYADALGFETVTERGVAAARQLRREMVYGGFSLGVMPAQKLAQTGAGVRGALFFHGCLPPSHFGGAWPAGVPTQIHIMEDDALGDVDIARAMAGDVDGAELYLYPGSDHLFTDADQTAYDPAATALVERRVLAFLRGLGG